MVVFSYVLGVLVLIFVLLRQIRVVPVPRGIRHACPSSSG